MKILVISLLRLGDLVMHSEIIDQLINEGNEVDLLVNSGVAGFSQSLHGVRKVHQFPRQTLQDELVLTSGSVFKAFKILKGVLVGIRSEGYQKVIDLTHNRVSRAIVNAVAKYSDEKINNRYLNEIFSLSRNSSFHYVDALKLAHNISIQLGSIANAEPVGNAGNLSDATILLQPLTSDTKKNWGLNRYRELAFELCKKKPLAEIGILCAPNEKEMIEKAFSDLNERFCNLSIHACDLNMLQDLVAGADLLISGDTSVIHFAARAGTRCIGIYSGSADVSKTAPRLIGSYVFSSTEECAPCTHSLPCHRDRHYCADSIPSKDVIELCLLILNKSEDKIRDLSWAMSFSVTRTEVNSLGYVYARNLVEVDSQILSEIRQASFNKIFQLSNSNRAISVDSFHGEIWEMPMWLEDQLGHWRRNQAIAEEFEKTLRNISRACVRMDLSVELEIRNLKRLVEEFRQFSGDSEWSAVLERHLSSSKKLSPFAVYKNWRPVIGHLNQFTAEMIGHLNHLKNQVKQKGVAYVSGPPKAT